MPGRIVHGNEILVLLGDNWFLECPCSHALGIVKRRINYCDDRIKDFTDELQLYENCLKLKGTLVPEQEGLVEIKEDFDTEAEAKWKQQRKEKLKATKKQYTRLN